MYRYNPKKTRTKKKNTTKNVAYKALALAKANRRVMETKRDDLTITPTTIGYTPTAYTLLTSAYGDTANEDRIGNQITLKGVHLKMTARSSTAATSLTLLRVLVVMKKTPGAFSVTDYFENAGGAVNSYNSLKKWDNRFQFKTFYDRTFAVDSGFGSGYGNVVLDKYFKIPKNLQNVTYDDAGNYESGHPALILVSNQNTNYPTIHINTRSTFLDA